MDVNRRKFYVIVLNSEFEWKTLSVNGIICKLILIFDGFLLHYFLVELFRIKL